MKSSSSAGIFSGQDTFYDSIFFVKDKLRMVYYSL